MRDETRRRLDQKLFYDRLKWIGAGMAAAGCVAGGFWLTGLDANVETRRVAGVVENVGPLVGAKSIAIEEGLAVDVKLADGRYSAGGWSDLAPVLALKNIGCKRVVYVQRQGDESVFAAQIAVQLGMSEAKWKALYDLSTQDSGYAVSVAKADAVWCTNWNAFTATQQAELAKDAYNAPFELRGISRRKQLREYARSSTTPLGIVGCSAGVRGTKTWQDIAGK